MNVPQSVRELFEKKTGIKAVDPRTPFRDLPGWDSLRHAEFIIAVQKEFKIRLTPLEISCFECLEKAVEVVQGKVK